VLALVVGVLFAYFVLFSIKRLHAISLGKALSIDDAGRGHYFSADDGRCRTAVLGTSAGARWRDGIGGRRNFGICGCWLHPSSPMYAV